MQYTIQFLLSRRQCGVCPAGLDEAVALIKSLNIEKEWEGPQHQHPYHQSQRGRGGRPFNQRGKKQFHPQNRRHLPTIKVTRLPLKDGRSALTLLLNKLGDENNELIVEKVAKTFMETEDLSELVTWFIDKTLPQTSLADTFALMWKGVFEVFAPVKSLYMSTCKQSFEAIAFDSSESDDRRIVELSHTIASLFRRGAITMLPLAAMIRAHVDRVSSTMACLDALSILTAEDLLPARKVMHEHVTGLSLDKRVELSKILIECLTSDKIHLNISILLMRAILSLPTLRQERLHLTHSDIKSPSPHQASLFVALDDRLGSDFLIGMTRTILERLETEPTLVDSALVLLGGCGKRMPQALTDQAVSVGRGFVESRLKHELMTPKLRFKFMDLLDLHARGWNPKRR